MPAEVGAGPAPDTEVAVYEGPVRPQERHPAIDIAADEQTEVSLLRFPTGDPVFSYKR